MANPLNGAYQEIRVNQKKPFALPTPQKTVSLNLDKVFFSYLNEALRNKTGHNVKYLYYQYKESQSGNDSYGVHFAIDFVNTIVEVTDKTVIVSAEAVFYQTDNKSKIKKNSVKFANLNEYIKNIGIVSGSSTSLDLVESSGAAHTRASGFDLTGGTYTVAGLL